VAEDRAASRGTVIVIASLSMVAFGIVLASLGASIPVIIERFGLDKREAGGLLALMNFAILAASIVFGPVVDRRGYKGMLVASFFAIIAGIMAIALAPSRPLLRAGVFLTGFSGGLVNGAANALVADVVVTQRAAALTFVGGFFGVGAAGVPFALALLGGRLSHTAVLVAAAGVVALPLVLTAFAPLPAAKQPRGLPLAHARGLLGDRVLLLMGVMLFLESGIESTAGGWITTYFAEELAVTADRAAMYLALFWAGLMITRLTLGKMLLRVRPAPVLFLSLAVGFGSSILLLVARGAIGGSVAVFLLGCGFAPMFPIVYGLVGDRHAGTSGTALSVVIAMALAGGMTMPYVTGVLADHNGLRPALVIVPAAVVALAILVAIVLRRLEGAAPRELSYSQHVEERA